MTERVGVFGGTFDPPHLGHVILAMEAVYQLKLDKLLWMLTTYPPHKRTKTISTLAARLEMVQAVVTLDPAFELSRVDIDRPGPHFSADTLRILRTQNPSAEIIFLVGGDSLHDLPDWERPLQLLDACHELGVMRRPGDSVDLGRLETVLPGITSKVRFMDVPLLDISSSGIQARITAGRPYRFFLPPVVYDILQTRKFYASGIFNCDRPA
jgi:nicotinate-nucleotide adenylyltransferase